MYIEGIGEFSVNKYNEVIGPEIQSDFMGYTYQFELEFYLEDEDKEGFHQAINNFTTHFKQALKDAEIYIYHYYLDVREAYEKEGWVEGFPEISSASQVWSHLNLAQRITVSRRQYKEKKVYISLGGNCDWEHEHGIQIVLKEGLYVNKVSDYNAHLTNSDAYDQDEYENVVYVGTGM
jgi:hypothetical protein